MKKTILLLMEAMLIVFLITMSTLAEKPDTKATKDAKIPPGHANKLDKDNSQNKKDAAVSLHDISGCSCEDDEDVVETSTSNPAPAAVTGKPDKSDNNDKTDKATEKEVTESPIASSASLTVSPEADERLPAAKPDVNHGGMASGVQGDFAFALHLLPPLGESVENASSFDRTLIDHLNVTILRWTNGDGIPVVWFCSGDDRGMDSLRLQDHHYHVNWKLDSKNPTECYRIEFSVAGLAIGIANVTPGVRRTVPVKFRVDPVPEIRVRVMYVEGASALMVAEVLRDQFAMSAEDAADLILAEGYLRQETGEAILVVYPMDAYEGAAFLWSIGYAARETYDVLMAVFDIQDEVEIEEILYAAGYDPTEFIDFTARGSVEKFAPVLKFDGSYKGIPMSAQTYFQTMLTLTADPATDTITWTTPWDGPSPCEGGGLKSVCSRDECNCGMQNSNFSALTAGEVPTYYMALSDIKTTGDGRLRIAYWWFYGFQSPCSYVDGCPGADGSHHGDWEKVIVTTDADRTRADAVTFEFHGDWYTRQYGSFEMVGDRPAVYVGKLGHGNYHSNEISGWMAGTPHHCCEYADYRNPKSSTIWSNTYDNLVSLRGAEEPWMIADPIGSTYEYQSDLYTITNWRWGPHISYCDFWLLGCWKWKHTYACQTHPTTYNLNWDLGSCSAEGCGTNNCQGLVYTHDAHYNQDWPWP